MTDRELAVVSRVKLSSGAQGLTSMDTGLALWQKLNPLLEKFQCKPPFEAITPPRVRNLFIFNSLQNQQLRKQLEMCEGLCKEQAAHIKRLEDQEIERLEEAYEGALWETFQSFKSREVAERQRWLVEAERAKTRYWLQKEIRRCSERLRALSGDRDRGPTKEIPADWFSPMPVFHESTPFGYCQATRQNRKRLQRFLGKIKATPTEEPSKGRGRPMALYGFSTNMRVLEQWLSKWINQEPNVLADKVETLLIWQSLETHECTRKQHKEFRAILYSHWQRARPKVTDAEIIAHAPYIEMALTDDLAWQSLLERKRFAP